MNKSKLVDRIGRFTVVPNKAIELMPRIGQDAFCLFSYLRYRTNSESEISFPGYETIRRDTGLHPRKIAKAIRILESAELIERKKRFGKSTIYVTRLPSSSTIGSNDTAYSSSTVGSDSSSNGVQTNKTKINKTKNSDDKSSKRDPLLDNQAIIAYRDHAHLTPNHDQREEIARRVGDKVEQWREIVKTWMLAGYRPQNVAGMLDAFDNGGLGKRNGQSSEKLLEFTA